MNIKLIAKNGAFIVEQGKELFVGELPMADIQKVINAIHKYPSVDKIVCGRIVLIFMKM